LIGGIQEPRLINPVSPGIRPGDCPPVGLEFLGRDEFVVVGRIGDLRHSGRDSCDVDKKEDGWDPMRFVPQTSRTYIVPRIPVSSPSFPLVRDMIPPRLPILSSSLHRLLIPPLHLRFLCHRPSPLFAIPPCHVFLMTHSRPHTITTILLCNWIRSNSHGTLAKSSTESPFSEKLLSADAQYPTGRTRWKVYELSHHETPPQRWSGDVRPPL